MPNSSKKPVSVTTKSLVVLDIDGTLLDEEYQSNYPDLTSEITRLSALGVSFCINSNRALHDLLPVAQQFNITGPLIGENGIFVYDPTTNSTGYLLPKEMLGEVESIKENAEKLLYAVLQEQFPNTVVHWIDENTVEAISHHQSSMFEEDSIVVLNNKYRQYTVSAHLKQSKATRLISMTEQVSKVAELLSNHPSLPINCTVNYSQAFGNILMHSNFISKRTALQKLREIKMYDQIYVIGDELNDFEMVDGFGTFLAPNNA